MERKTLSTILITTAIILILALLGFTLAGQSEQRKSSIESNQLIYDRIDELEKKVRTDTIVQMKDCEIKSLQTVMNMFSPQSITKESTLEYDFDIFSNEAYEYYQMMCRTFKGEQLLTAGVNSAGYDSKTGEISTYVWFHYDSSETRNQFNFVFRRQSDKWIIDRFDADS